MVRNQEKAIQLKELMETLLEAIPEMMDLLQKNSLSDFYQLSEDYHAALSQIKQVAEQENEEEYLEVKNIAHNCLVSLERLLQYAKYNREKAMQKIEFEFWPFLRIMHIQFYFFALIYPDKEKMDEWYAGEGKELCKNYYVEEAERIGNYKYDVSILITAYNKLEYTQLCVQKILENLPKDIKCELILRNHGSTDGTKEFFEKICPTKQIDFAINRAGSKSTWFTYEGKYVFLVSNDVLITPNMIETLYEAFEENDDYAFAVPMTPNISNLQVPLKLNNGNSDELISYETVEELDVVAREFNKRNPRKEEVRYRLCDPLAFLRNRCANLQDRTSLMAIEFTQHTKSMFPDDLRSMYMRRAGYKNVLMKDLIAHHYGSITIKDENLQAKNYAKGRELFLDNNGIDPWGHGFCWTYALFDKLLCNKSDCKQILGINCGMGSNILKIQQEIKEHTGNLVHVTALTDNQRHVPDLLSLTDLVLVHEGWQDIRGGVTEMYDYILVDDNIGDEYQKNINALYSHVEAGGKLIVFLRENEDKVFTWIKEKYDNVVVSEKTSICYEIDEEIVPNMPIGGYYLILSKN